MLKLLKNLSKKDVLFAFISFVLIAVQVYLDLKIPDYISHDLPVVTTAFGERGFLLDEKDGFFISSLANSLVIS